MARRDHRRDAAAGRRPAGEAPAGTGLLRPGRDDAPPRPDADEGVLPGFDAPGEAPIGVLSGAQEAFGSGLHPAARGARAAVQRRVLGRLLRPLRAPGAGPAAPGPRAPRRGPAPAAPARARRREDQHPRRAGAEDLRGGLLPAPRDPRHHRAAAAGGARQPERRDAGRLRGGRGPARVSAPRRRPRRARRDPQPAGGGGRAQPQARRHRAGDARLRGPEDLRDPQRRRAGPDARPRDEARLQRPQPRRGA